VGRCEFHYSVLVFQALTLRILFQAVEDGDPDVISDMVNDKRNKKSRARAIKDQEFDGSGQSTPIGTDDEPKARKANGKGKGKQTPMRASPPATNKRKRTTTSHSVTPSVDDYDDEPRDSVCPFATSFPYDLGYRLYG
jgi:hypothetical protein